MSNSTAASTTSLKHLHSGQGQQDTLTILFGVGGTVLAAVGIIIAFLQLRSTIRALRPTQTHTADTNAASDDAELGPHA